MIVSASYRTDIPAFYGPWFLSRLRAGFCRVANPYGGETQTVALAGPDVDGFVFWTRNVGPFVPALDEVAGRGLPFVLQQTVTGYPRALDAATVAAERAVADLARVARAFGPRACVWRYDPIVISSPTPPEWHRATFARLAAALGGVVDEVVVSFLQVYRKTARNMVAAGVHHGFAWEDPPAEAKRVLIEDLARLARRHGIRLSVCGQPALAAASSAAEASCVDAGRLAAVAGRPISAVARAHRTSCACHASRDIGAYDSCPHGCVYCYAVNSRAVAKRRFAGHDPEGEFLIPPAAARAASLSAGSAR